MSRLTERERGIEQDPLWFLPGIEPPSLKHGSVVGPAGMSAISVIVSSEGEKVAVSSVACRAIG